MLARIVLQDAELAELSSFEVLALEYVLHDRLAELARHRRSGDSALLLAIRAARYLEPMIDELGADHADAMLDAVRHSSIGQTALERTAEVAALAETARAA